MGVLVCIYSAEAHPCGEGNWDIYTHVDYDQPKEFPERLALAEKTFRLAKRDGLFVPVVDLMDNRAEKAYSSFPERLYVIEDGRIVLKGGKGPDGYSVDELESFLRSS